MAEGRSLLSSPGLPGHCQRTRLSSGGQQVENTQERKQESEAQQNLDSQGLLCFGGSLEKV